VSPKERKHRKKGGRREGKKRRKKREEDLIDRSRESRGPDQGKRGGERYLRKERDRKGRSRLAGKRAMPPTKKHSGSVGTRGKGEGARKRETEKRGGEPKWACTKSQQEPDRQERGEESTGKESRRERMEGKSAQKRAKKGGKSSKSPFTK